MSKILTNSFANGCPLEFFSRLFQDINRSTEQIQWRIQDLPRGVNPTGGGGSANIQFDQIFQKTAWKWRKFGPGEERVPRAP